MWDDENDKKLRDAAENFQPALDENAWQKMEQMLDENLPQKKDRKRILFFIPLILILGGFVFFIFFYNNGQRNLEQANVRLNTSANANKSKEKQPNEKTITLLNSGKNSAVKAITTAGNIIQKNESAVIRESGKAFIVPVSKNKNKNNDVAISHEDLDNHSLNTDTNPGDSKPTNPTNSVSENKELTEINNSKVDEKQQEEKNILSAATSQTKENKAGKKSVRQKEKKQNDFGNNFSIGFSTAPGESFVGSNEGKLTLDLGIIAGYRFAKHFGVHTGVFISKKIYSATPGEYTLPTGPSYYYLQKINANCNVIDIPLNVDYYFAQKGKHGWLVSAGLSSYLMKKESYDYFYKTPAGQTYNKDWSISNQNHHFFSVLDLSAGYQYLLNKQFSLAAQPYIDLPLTGIGAGKVKLNSAGVLFTIKAKPFLKKSKK
jgi:hypothetical protein